MPLNYNYLENQNRKEFIWVDTFMSEEGLFRVGNSTCSAIDWEGECGCGNAIVIRYECK